jgi:hypothetical protein
MDAKSTSMKVMLVLLRINLVLSLIVSHIAGVCSNPRPLGWSQAS